MDPRGAQSELPSRPPREDKPGLQIRDETTSAHAASPSRPCATGNIADTQTGYIADTLDGNFVVGCMSMFEPNRVASL